MRVNCQGKWRIITVLALFAISATLLISTSVLTRAEPTQPSELGSGPACLTSVTASTSGRAWIFTSPDFVSTPEQTEGSIQIFACTRQAGMTSIDNPTAEVVAKFTYPSPGGSQYMMKFTCVLPSQMGFNGVEVLKSVFGSTSTNIPGITMPETLAYISVIGNATITKDGAIIAENQPAIVMVTSAIHDSSQRLLTQADPSRREIQLVVPGAKAANSKEVEGFPSGSFYIYWPSASLNMNNVGGVVQQNEVMPPPTVVTTPATIARGPVIPMKLHIILTDNGIVNPMREADAGLYDITLTNKSSTPRGLYMTGTDICCTEFNRYSKVLKRNQSQSFRFYFAAGKVEFKDMLKCVHRARTCAVAKFGKHTSSMVFK
ncbi:MAG: hypothetical protein NT018_10595 [Armatimonadetes bacterium]|nr:hypothetical protein [Armatimonadota bacterium]